jgi:hypothetical protein
VIITCDRCKREVFKSESCGYCRRRICVSCMKSSQRVRKVNRLVICKDCWSNTRKRKIFKNNNGMMPAAAAQRAAY